jgi:glycosyltransferase involved in cell wall biosynthesis
MQRIVAQRLDRVINVSQASAQETQCVFKIPQSKLRVVYNGIDTQTFRKQDGVLKEPNSLIMVGNTEDRKKGILYLLQAMQILKDGVKIKLTIVDRKPPDTLYAPQLVREFGLEDRVTFSGRLDVAELVRCYSAAEIAITPSLYEGFGFPPAEAMSCGLPVITTRGGALPEVVGEDGEAGILVPPADPRSLAAAIKQLLANEPLRRKMGEAGRKRIERLFTWEEAAKKTVEVYQEVL